MSKSLSTTWLCLISSFNPFIVPEVNVTAEGWTSHEMQPLLRQELRPAVLRGVPYFPDNYSKEALFEDVVACRANANVPNLSYFFLIKKNLQNASRLH